MSDRWMVKDDDGQVFVIRNGSWYTDVEDLDEGVAIVSNQRAKEVVVVYRDGFRETRRL